VPSGQAPQHRTFGDQVVAGLLQSTDRHKFDLQVTDRAGAMRKIDKADVYGAIVIPRDFTSASLLLAQSAARDTKAVRPVIQVLTNPRARTLCASIAFSYATRALAQANSGLGAQLNDTVTQQAQAKGLTLTGAAQTTPAAPIDV